VGLLGASPSANAAVQKITVAAKAAAKRNKQNTEAAPPGAPQLPPPKKSTGACIACREDSLPQVADVVATGAREVVTITR
jgi:hypothetical protein